MTQTIEQIVSNMKRRSPGSVLQGPCVGGWVTCWRDPGGRTWIQFREDMGEGERSILHPAQVEHDPHTPKVPKVSKYNFCTCKRTVKS
jgi:hypothetical protein